SSLSLHDALPILQVKRRVFGIWPVIDHDLDRAATRRTAEMDHRLAVDRQRVGVDIELREDPVGDQRAIDGALLLLWQVVDRADRVGPGRGWRLHGSLPALPLALAQGSLDLALAVPRAQRLPLVVLLLTARHRDLDLGDPARQIHLQGDDGEPFLLDAAQQAIDLLAMEQQLARAQRLVPEVTRLIVGGDVRVNQPQLAVARLDVALPQVDVPGANRLDLGAH